MPDTSHTTASGPSAALVSIVIPTFNRAAMLPKAIETSLAQTHPVEVIVVNHGSTDDTDAVVAGYGEQVRYLRRDEDFGPHFCWLEGVLHAKSDFVHLQYDDDWIEPSFVAECMKVMADDVGFAFTSAHVVNDETQDVLFTMFEDWLPASGSYPSHRIEKPVLESLISPAAALYRKQILIDGLYQGRLPLSNSSYHGVGPDCFVSLLSMLRYDKVGYVREALAYFRSHDGSITVDADRTPGRYRELEKAYSEAKRYYREMKLLKRLRRLMRYK